MTDFPYRRLVVIGTTSSGKSTLARRLANQLGLEFVELDALHWEANWQEAPDDVFRRRTEAAILGASWAVAGNYHQVRDLVWRRAQALVWLDYSFPRVFWQLTMRTIKRLTTREVLWGKNTERLWTHLKLWSADSLFHWLFKTYWRRRREYPQLFAEPRYAHLAVFRFRSPREVDKWLAGLPDSPARVRQNEDAAD